MILHNALRIIRNLELDDAQRAPLFARAETRYAAHVKAKKEDFALSYLALQLMFDPAAALPIFRQWLNCANEGCAAGESCKHSEHSI